MIAVLQGGELLECHEPSVCAGNVCPVHNPSDHHMRTWRQHWRSDAAKMERICRHGIGHPDPDHVAHRVRTGQQCQYDLVHGCDGCCVSRTWLDA